MHRRTRFQQGFHADDFMKFHEISPSHRGRGRRAACLKFRIEMKFHEISEADLHFIEKIEL